MNVKIDIEGYYRVNSDNPYNRDLLSTAMSHSKFAGLQFEGQVSDAWLMSLCGINTQGELKYSLKEDTKPAVPKKIRFLK